MRYTTETEVRDASDPAGIAAAVAALRRGGLVAFPTETVYGLGAMALDADAVARIYSAKGRPSHNPLIVHLAAPEMISRVARDVPPLAGELATEFWPGPLTLVVVRQACVPDIVTAGGPTVAVRVPAHPVARALLAAVGEPVVAPSANRFTRPSATTAAHVLADLRGHVDVVLDGGPTPIGVESTVLDLTQTPPVVLRPGGISLEQLQARVPEVRERSDVHDRAVAATGQPLASPGLLARHYAPEAEVLLHAGTDHAKVRAAMVATARARRTAGDRVAVLARAGDAAHFADLGVRVIVLPDDLEAIAHDLFGILRDLDGSAVDVVIVRQFEPTGLGRTLADRLRRAADGREIAVD